jgi:hypothetical protein
MPSLIFECISSNPLALMSFVKNTGEPSLSCGKRAGLEPLFEDWRGFALKSEGANNDPAVIPSPAARNLRRLGIAGLAEASRLLFPGSRFCIRDSLHFVVFQLNRIAFVYGSWRVGNHHLSRFDSSERRLRWRLHRRDPDQLLI